MALSMNDLSATVSVGEEVAFREAVPVGVAGGAVAAFRIDRYLARAPQFR